MGLSILRGYFIYGCNHSGVRQCLLYKVERLSASRSLAIQQFAKTLQLTIVRGTLRMHGAEVLEWSGNEGRYDLVHVARAGILPYSYTVLRVLPV